MGIGWEDNGGFMFFLMVTLLRTLVFMRSKPINEKKMMGDHSTPVGGRLVRGFYYPRVIILGIVIIQERGTPITQPVQWNNRGILNTAHL